MTPKAIEQLIDDCNWLLEQETDPMLVRRDFIKAVKLNLILRRNSLIGQNNKKEPALLTL